jgi:hypothetical protein
MMMMNLQMMNRGHLPSLIRLRTGKARRRNLATTERQTFQLSAFTMRLGYVGRVEETKISDLDSHTDCCVFGKEVLVLNDFDREVTVTGWDPKGETQSLRIVSASMGYTIPQSGITVLLIVDQSILSPTLNHNLLSTTKMRLHDAIVN